MDEVKLIVFISLLRGENYNEFIISLNNMGFQVSNIQLLTLIKTIKYFLLFRNNHSAPIHFKLQLKILLDIYNLIESNYFINFTTVNHNIYNNSYRPYLSYNNNQLIQLLHNEHRDYFITSNLRVNPPVNLTFNESDEEMEIEPIQPNQVNPNQLEIVTDDALIPKTNASWQGACVVCGETDPNDWCRVNCPAGHIGHCSCFNRWKNTHTSYINYDTNTTIENEGFHNECPFCRGEITKMVRVQPNTSFGKKIKKFKKETLKFLSLEKDIKYLNKLKVKI